MTDTETRLLNRRALLAITGGAGALLAIPALARDYHEEDDDKDSSGSGGGHDHHDDDSSGSGSDHDDDHDHGHDTDTDASGSDDEGDVAPQGTVPPGSVEVRIVDDDADGFQPGTITIDPGQQVTFVNLDDDPHTATGAGFDTGIIDPGQQATVTFDEPGSFPYACQIHPVMTGTVEVRGAAGASPEASPASTPAATGGEATVTIVDFAFDPAEIEVAAGTSVTWTNQDSVPHTATAEDGSFDTGAIDQGASGSHTFDTPGEYPYICAFHPNMQGVVRVT